MSEYDDYADDYEGWSEEDKAEEARDLMARVAALQAAEADAEPEPEPPAFDRAAHRASVDSLVNANYDSAEDFFAAAAARGLTAEADVGEPVPVAPSAEAKQALLDPNLSESEFWRRANAAGLVHGNEVGIQTLGAEAVL